MIEKEPQPVEPVEPVDSGLSVISYIKEEVQRQGHDIMVLDGIERVGWMLNAWSSVLRTQQAIPHRKPELYDIDELACRIEPYKNQSRRKVRIRVTGSREVFPDPVRIAGMLESLFEERDQLTPLEFYRRFEQIHPYVDGNGRLGKILLNWLNGTLLEPVFPPDDFWGTPIVNP